MVSYSRRLPNGDYEHRTMDDDLRAVNGVIELGKATIRRRAEVLSLISFILGVLAVPLCWSFVVPAGAVVLGIMGAIFSAKTSVNGAFRVFSILGIVFGLIGLVAMVVLFVFLAVNYT